LGIRFLRCCEFVLPLSNEDLAALSLKNLGIEISYKKQRYCDGSSAEL
jgi:hypothetical protein